MVRTDGDARRGPVAALLPGIALAGLITAAAYGVRLAPGMGSLSPMILAIALGAVMSNLIGVPDVARAGLTFAMRRLLRIAIVLLGLQLTISQVIAVGAGGVVAIVVTLIATFAVTTWLGRRLGVDRGLTQLIAAGTSICGASAIMAANTVTRAPDEDVAYAVACVTLFGTVAMLAYPLLPGVLNLDPLAYGLWTGASIHEIAQVVGASFAQGQAAGEFGTVAKLARVMMLAPVVIALGLIAARATGAGPAGRANAPTPWFALGFVALIVVNSVFAIPVEVKEFAAPVTTLLLTVALAAMGIGANIAELRARGFRPLLLGLCSFLFIAVFSLGLVKLLT
ncbi:YeiH family protein [Methylopila turkensis]|uniref:YeiH family protein n=1 Tax=Methylopila turkensis TaxID=1437816 RepID=UPI0022F346F4|nr:YeiH family protein [Methylopila turkensis]